jgi:hypothetical protein
LGHMQQGDRVTTIAEAFPEWNNGAFQAWSVATGTPLR